MARPSSSRVRSGKHPYHLNTPPSPIILARGHRFQTHRGDRTQPTSSPDVPTGPESPPSLHPRQHLRRTRSIPARYRDSAKYPYTSADTTSEVPLALGHEIEKTLSSGKHCSFNCNFKTMVTLMPTPRSFHRCRGPNYSRADGYPHRYWYLSHDEHSWSVIS